MIDLLMLGTDKVRNFIQLLLVLFLGFGLASALTLT